MSQSKWGRCGESETGDADGRVAAGGCFSGVPPCRDDGVWAERDGGQREAGGRHRQRTPPILFVQYKIGGFLLRGYN